MQAEKIEAIRKKQQVWFQTGATLPVSFRKEMLRKLLAAIEAQETQLLDALTQDLGKSHSEGYMCELAMVKSEIRFMLSHVSRYAGERTVLTPLAQTLSRSYEKPVPYGNVLIMSPWNYPLLLSLDPLADAIAAGNTAIIKPSAYAPATAQALEDLVRSCFPEEYVSVIQGGRKENAALLDSKFDYIFFTGSKAVGKEVMRKAAEHLTPITLELGGKSPCIVDETANIPLAAKRIVFGKFVNCGQTCVAPDYIYVHESVKDRLVEELKKQIGKQYTADPIHNEKYGKIITQKHFDRICRLIDPRKVVCGGESNPATRKIAPTILDGVTWEDAVMQEEIFGPVLPILTYTDLNQVAATVNAMETPLALYIFSSSKKNIGFVTSRIAYGGGCVNDTIIHLATSAMGFGGCGESGMGSYHGKHGFDTFTHYKSIVDKKTILDLPMRYQPYNKLFDTLIRMFVR